MGRSRYNFPLIIFILIALLAVAFTYHDILPMRSLWSTSQRTLRVPASHNIYRSFATSKMSTNTVQSTMQDPKQQGQDLKSEQQTQEQDTEPLPLPPPPTEESTSKLDMSTGEATVKMDALGPLVVNQDGTLSRIENWGQMTEIERRNTLRVLGKRNRERQEALKAKEAEGKGA